MHRILCFLLAATLCFFVTGCSEKKSSPSASADAAASDAADTNTADATIERASGCQTAAPAGVARVRESCSIDGPSPTYIASLTSDLFIENSTARYVFRIGDGAGLMIMGSGPGGIVDAIPAVDGQYQPSLDRLLEFIAFPGLRTIHETEHSFGNNPDDGSAFIQIQGTLTPLPIIHEALPILGTSGTASITWTLHPDSPVLEMDVTFTPDGTKIQNATVALILMHSGSLDTYIPEQGFNNQAAGKGSLLAGSQPGYSVGFKSEGSMSFLEAGGLTLLLPEASKASSETPANSRYRFAVTTDSVDSLIDLLEQREVKKFSVEVNVFTESPFPGKSLILEYGPKDQPASGRAAIESDGTATVDLPEGEHWFKLFWEDGPHGEIKELTVKETNNSLEIPPPTAGMLSLGAQEKSTPNVLVPARAMITATDDSYARTLALSPHTPTDILVSPGSYNVIVMRGHEYDADEINDIVISDQEAVSLLAEVERVVDTSGWIAADFHLHCEFSADSELEIEQRILEVAAEGVEFAVSTEHDFVSSYQPIRDNLDLGNFLAVEDGVEASHPTLAHITSWPISPVPGASGRGAPNWLGLTPGEIFAMLGEGNPQQAFQLNHARSTSGYLNRTGYDPETGAATKSASSLGYDEGTPLAGFDYDSMEIYNGKREVEFEDLFKDWLSFIAQGFSPAPTGTSDSHSSGSYPGAARTFVWVGEGRDDPASITTAEVLAGVKSGRTLVVGGAFVELWLMDASGSPETAAGVTEILHEAGDTARARVRIQAPAWMPVDRLELFHNRELALDITITPEMAIEGSAVRLDQVFEIPVENDSFFTVKVTSDSSPAPYLNRAIKSLAGPVYLNADGDDSYEAPGLGLQE